jgi:hypothetical protein
MLPSDGDICTEMHMNFACLHLHRHCLSCISVHLWYDLCHHRWWKSSSLCSFHHPPVSSILLIQILPAASCCQIPSVYHIYLSITWDFYLICCLKSVGVGRGSHFIVMHKVKHVLSMGQLFMYLPWLCSKENYRKYEYYFMLLISRLICLQFVQVRLLKWEVCKDTVFYKSCVIAVKAKVQLHLKYQNQCILVTCIWQF